MSEHVTERPRKETLSPAPGPGLPFSRVVGYRDLVFVAGTVGRDPETNKISPDVGEQTRQALDAIRGQLAGLADTSMNRVLKTTVFLVDMELYEGMNQAYRGFFPHEPPARSCVEVGALPDEEALVEIEVIAAR